MEGEFSHSHEAQEQTVEYEPIPNVEEVFPGGFRLTKGATILDVPESWAIFDGQGFLVIDPGGELPIESKEDALSLKPIAATVTNSLRSHKIDGLRKLLEQRQTPITGILLTHGDADHTNNLENITDQGVPVYVDRKEWWSTLSPEKQFAAGAMNFQKSELTSHDAGSLRNRDAGMQIFAERANNARGGSDRHARKAALAERFHVFPESFETAGAGRMEVVALPGHAPGEHGFYLPEQKLFIGGDLITTSKQGQVDRINVFLPEANVYDAVMSLKKLQAMDIDKYYPAHGSPIIGVENFREHIQNLLLDAETLIERILEQAEQHAHADVHQLIDFVFTPQFHRAGMVAQSKKSWIFSVLRDKSMTTDLDELATS